MKFVTIYLFSIIGLLFYFHKKGARDGDNPDLNNSGLEYIS